LAELRRELPVHRQVIQTAHRQLDRRRDGRGDIGNTADSLSDLNGAHFVGVQVAVSKL
jgi:hypothetical protein